MNSIVLILPASVRYLGLLSDCIAALMKQCDGLVDIGTHIYNCQVAAHELGANLIRHAYQGRPGMLQFALRWTDETRQFELESCDEGSAFDPAGQTKAIWSQMQTTGVWKLDHVSPVEWTAN